MDSEKSGSDGHQLPGVYTNALHLSDDVLLNASLVLNHVYKHLTFKLLSEHAAASPQ